MTMGRERLVSTVTEEEEGDIDICSNSDLSDCARWVQCWCSRSEAMVVSLARSADRAWNLRKNWPLMYQFTSIVLATKCQILLADIFLPNFCYCT